MPTTADESQSSKKLLRSNAVWDLTSIPLDTPLELQLKIEIHSTASPLTVDWESSSLTRVIQLRKFVAGLIPHNFRLEVNDEILCDHAYLYEYCLVANDVVKVYCE
jgi:hypothetical protein